MNELSELTDIVVTKLISKLEGWGNQISFNHKKALYAIASHFAEDAIYDSPARWAIGLDTGLGKTQLLITFLNTLKELNSIYPVLVCVPNMRAMNEFRKGLLEAYSEDEIGCKFSSSSASQVDFSSTPDSELNAYQVLITCHARVDGTKEEFDRLLSCNGVKRTVFYDEALKRGQSFGGNVIAFRQDMGLIAPYLSEDALSYLSSINEALSSSAIVSLATSDEVKENIKSAMLLANLKRNKGKFVFEVIEPLISGRYDQLRHENGDIFSFIHTLPDMQSLFVLDANHEFSILSQLDDSIEKLNIDKFKMFNHVAFKAYDLNLGQTKINKNKQLYLEWTKDRVEEAIAEGLNPVVICSLKMKPLIEAMGYPLITWGMHAGSNSFTDKDALICVGLLRLSDEVTKGEMTLVQDNIGGTIEGFQQIAKEEALLNLYQAVSRGSSRRVKVEDGKTVALPSTIYLSGPLDPSQITLLHRVMPGCKYLVARYDKVISDILHYVATVESEEGITLMNISSSVPSYKDLPNREKLKAISLLEPYGWWKRGRSIYPSRFPSLTNLFS